MLTSQCGYNDCCRILSPRRQLSYSRQADSVLLVGEGERQRLARLDRRLTDLLARGQSTQANCAVYIGVLWQQALQVWQATLDILQPRSQVNPRHRNHINRPNSYSDVFISAVRSSTLCVKA